MTHRKIIVPQCESTDPIVGTRVDLRSQQNRKEAASPAGVDPAGLVFVFRQIKALILLQMVRCKGGVNPMHSDPPRNAAAVKLSSNPKISAVTAAQLLFCLSVMRGDACEDVIDGSGIAAACILTLGSLDVLVIGVAQIYERL